LILLHRRGFLRQLLCAFFFLLWQKGEEGEFCAKKGVMQETDETESLCKA